MKTIVIDPGHGGHDPGATANGLKEKDLVLDISKRIQSKLKDYSGIKVIMTRTTDKYLALSQRANIANKAKADAFLSVHINAGGGTGFESFIYNGNVSGNTKTLQSNVHSNIIKQIDVANRGKKCANFAVLRLTAMPALLTENGFIDRKADANKLKDSKFLDKVADGHVNGIVKYFGLKKKKEDKAVPKKENHTPDPAHKAAWEKAVKKGVFDGTNPQRSLTREQAATVFDRLGLLDKMESLD